MFFFKQKTAYEMRISDWSSDVCSSDLEHQREPDREIDHVLHQIISENQIEGVYPEHGVPLLRTEPRRKRLVITRPVRPSFQRGTDRKSVVQGKSVSVRVDLGGRRSIHKK